MQNHSNVSVHTKMKGRPQLLVLLLLLTAMSDSQSQNYSSGELNEYCQCLNTGSRIIKLPGCGKKSNWSKCDDKFICQDLPWVTEESGERDNYLTSMTGELLMIEGLKGRDDGIYRCTVKNMTHTHTVFRNLTLFDVCHCSPSILQPRNNVILKNLPGRRQPFTCSAFVGPCAYDHQCTEPKANVTWTFTRSHDNHAVADTEDTDAKRSKGIVDTNFNHNLSAGITIVSTYTIPSVAEEDYGTYTCKVSTVGGNVNVLIPFEYGLPENGIWFPAPIIWLILTVCVIVACLLLVILVYAGYYHLLTIRVFYHLWFSKEEIGDYEYHGIVISTDSEDDVDFVMSHLLPKTEEEMKFKLAFSSRDFDVGSTDASYLEFMKQSRRLIFVVSSHSLLEPSVCNRAFTNAGPHRWSDMIFILMPDINTDLWTENNRVLKQVVDQSSDRPWARVRKLRWGVEWKVCGYDLSKWEEKSFWNRFLLAMPKAPATGSEHMNHVEMDNCESQNAKI